MIYLPVFVAQSTAMDRRRGPVERSGRLALWLGVAVACAVAAGEAQAQAPKTNSAAITDSVRPSGDAVLIEVTGLVETSAGTTNGWAPVTRGTTLRVGDRIRTGPTSRAALQLTDRSIVRLDHSTTVRLVPTEQTGLLRRFRLDVGRLFFFNREKPASIEFETPLTVGAIRGTEFLLSAPLATVTSLTLLDGAVELNSEGKSLNLRSGDQADLASGQPARVSRAVLVERQIQWALYYPAVVDEADLPLTAEDRTQLGTTLEAYRRGNILQALGEFPAGVISPGGRTLQAALQLGVGQVAEAEAALQEVPDSAAARAMRELIATVIGTAAPQASAPPNTASEWLARSYQLQAASNFPDALAAAVSAQQRAPTSGLAAARVAELAFIEEKLGLTRRSLAVAREHSPENPRIAALEGFVLLEANRPGEALAAFDRASALDAGFGNAWLGRGIALQHLSRHEEALAAFQAASALEPRRSLFRSYAAKSAAQSGDRTGARKELRLAQELDPRDPTPWLYSALERQQNNDLNDAVRDLEKSVALNDNSSVFRSRLGLDRDRAIRSADLAAVYDAVGLAEVSERAASRAVEADYSNYAGHLFVARSLQSHEDPSRFNLRYEAPVRSELLMANLLAPAGGGNLSQQLSQQDHLRYFDAPTVALASVTTWTDNGDWRQGASVFGTIDGLGYAIDGQYISLRGWRPNQDTLVQDLGFTAKQQVTASDSLYLQVGRSEVTAGDAAARWDPADANLDLRVKQTLNPYLHAGWNHEWAPGSHTLLLASYYSDELDLTDPTVTVPFLRKRGGVITSVDLSRAIYDTTIHSEDQLGSVELQQLWQSSIHTVIAGGRYQGGDISSKATLLDLGQIPAFNQDYSEPLERMSGYLYYQIEPASWVRLNAGGSYESLLTPRNLDTPPYNQKTERKDQLSPKVGLTLQPWERTSLQAAWSRSLGGLYYDNSLRLEPTRMAGFNQSFRSLIPESIAGIVPGTEFETAGVRLDHSWDFGLYLGASGERLTSQGDRDMGAVSNSLPFPLPDTAISAREELAFEERTVSVYANQVLGRYWALGSRYQFSQAELTTQFPGIPRNALGLANLEQSARATLQQVQLFGVFNHTSGWFARWESNWYRQNNAGYQNGLGDEDVWLHEVAVGYRFPQRRAEVRLGVVNLFNTDNRLNPLNLQAELARQRAVFLSLRLNL